MKTKRQVLREKEQTASRKRRFKFEQRKQKARIRLVREAKRNRNLAIQHAWAAGLTLAEIGNVVKLTKQGVSWVIKTHWEGGLPLRQSTRKRK